MSSELAVPQAKADNGYLAKAGMTLVPRNLTEAVEYAKVLAASNLVPKDYIGKPADVLVAIQHGMEFGFSPLQALGSIAVINGRPTLWGDAVLALVKASGLLESIVERDPQDALAQQCAECAVTRKGEAPMSRRFSLEDAGRANLIKRGGPLSPWTQYPGRMLQMRARSWALRDAFPDVLKGLRIREEEMETVEAHVIQEPRRLSDAPVLDAGAGDAALRNLKQAPSPAAGPQRQSSSSPAPVSAASSNGTVATGKVQNITQKEMSGKNGPWTKYTIILADSTSYQAKKAHAETAKQAKESDQEVRIGYVASQYGNDATSCEIVAAAKEPDDGGPGMFDGEAGAEG